MFLFDSGTSREDLDSIKVDAVDFCAVVCQESCEWAADYFAAVYDGDCFSEKTIPVWEDRVVDLEVLKDFDTCSRCTWKNGFEVVGWRVEEASVLVHVEDVFVGQTFDVFGKRDQFFDVRVLTRGVYWVVDYYAVDAWVGVCGQDCFFYFVFGDYFQVEVKATIIHISY